jgi:choline kinase
MSERTTNTVAILLAAGVGSRLRPLTDDRPKCLVSLGHETILHRAVRLLHGAGLRRLVVATGYRAEAVHRALAGAPLEVTFVDNPDYAHTQNVVSLARALEAVRPDEGFVKLDGDLVFTAPVLEALFAGTAAATVAVDRSGTLGAEEMKVLVHDGRVQRFGKGLDPHRAHGESIGIEWFTPSAAPRVRAALAAAVAQGRTDVYYEDVYNDVLDQLEMRAIDVPAGAWTEIDDAADLARAQALFAGR